MYDKVLTLIF